MTEPARMTPRQRLVFHIQELERVESLKADAAACLKDSFDAAKRDGFDASTLKVVLKLRKMTPDQRRERRALEAIYLAALGMLEGDPLTDEARRRLDPPTPPDARKDPDRDGDAGVEPAPEPGPESTTGAPDPSLPPVQPALALKMPDEAREEGAAAAAAGKRVYDNPYRAGDPCRAAWDEGWCAQQQSNGMETPAAYQRRSTKPPEPSGDADKKGEA